MAYTLPHEKYLPRVQGGVGPAFDQALKRWAELFSGQLSMTEHRWIARVATYYALPDELKKCQIVNTVVNGAHLLKMGTAEEQAQRGTALSVAYQLAGETPAMVTGFTPAQPEIQAPSLTINEARLITNLASLIQSTTVAYRQA